MKSFRILSLASVLLAVTLVYAAGNTANISLTAPTQYLDGKPLPLTDIDHYTVSWTGDQTGSMTIAAPATTGTAAVACGNVTFTATVTTNAAATYPNATSGPTNTVPYPTGITCSPKPPALVVH